jgi:hypothetical protein
MTDFDKIKKMVDNHNVHVGYYNAMYKAEGLTEKLNREGKEINEEFSAIVDEVVKSFHNLIRGYANVGIEIRDIDVVECYNEPYHVIFMKVGSNNTTFMGGCANKHFKVDGFPYHPKLKE